VSTGSFFLKLKWGWRIEVDPLLLHPAIGGEHEDIHSSHRRRRARPAHHLSTGKDSSLGLLVGQNSLLTMRELSEVRIAETVRNKQILEVAKGRVCLAVSRPSDAGKGSLTVRTPTR